MFISDDYAFKEEMQSTVNGLSLELQSIKELLLNAVPTKDPNSDCTQVQYLCKNPGPVEGPAPLTSVQKNLLGPQNQSEADDEESMERIPHYLKGKNVAKGTQENRKEMNILSHGPPSEPSSEPPDDKVPNNDARYHWVGVGPAKWNKLLGRPQVAILKRQAVSETTQHNTISI